MPKLKREKNFKLLGNDCAMIFRYESEEIEVLMPPHEQEDEIPPMEILMLSILDKLGTEPMFRDTLVSDFLKKHQGKKVN